MDATLDHDKTPLTLPLSKARRFSGIAMSAIPSLFLAFDAVMKLVPVQPVVEAMQKLGYPDGAARPLGAILLASVALYLHPRTAVLGVVLATAYLGGAVATHVRMGDPLLSHTLFPTYVAALLWGGLYLRDERLAPLAPWASDARRR